MLTLRRVSIITLLTLGFIVILILLPIWDIRPQDDSDLILPDVPASSQENAFTLAEEAVTLYDRLTEGYDTEPDALLRNWDDAAVQAWLAHFEEPLELFSQAAAFEDSQLETHYDDFDWYIPDLLGLRDLALGKRLEATWLQQQGDESAALAELLSTIRLSDIQMSTKQSFITALIGIAIKGIGLNGVDALLEDGDLSLEDYRTAIAILAPLTDSSEDVKGAFQAEYMMARLVIQKVSFKELQTIGFLSEDTTDPLPMMTLRFQHLVSQLSAEQLPVQSAGLSGIPFKRAPYLMQTNRTLHILADYYRAHFNAIESCNVPSELSDDLQRYIESIVSQVFHNVLGKVFLAMFVPNMSNSIMMNCERDAQLRRQLIRLALAAHQLEQGSYPESLDTLVPMYLEEVPVNPFTRKAPEYDAAARTLIFAGSDLPESLD